MGDVLVDVGVDDRARVEAGIVEGDRALEGDVARVSNRRLSAPGTDARLRRQRHSPEDLGPKAEAGLPPNVNRQRVLDVCSG
jgi:hypothetical protein